MTATRRLVLTLSPELYARLEERAAERRLDAREWALRVLLAALTPSAPESEAARERRSRKAGFALLSLLAGRPASQERSPHVPHT